MSEHSRWVFTFGGDHVHPVTGEELRNRYVIVEGTDAEARKKMWDRFGAKWSMQYRDETAAGVFKYALREVDL